VSAKYLNRAESRVARCPALKWTIRMGGDLGETGGRSQKTFEVGDSPCICPRNILRTTGSGCEKNYKVTKNSVQEEFRVVK